MSFEDFQARIPVVTITEHDTKTDKQKVRKVSKTEEAPFYEAVTSRQWVLETQKTEEVTEVQRQIDKRVQVREMLPILVANIVKLSGTTPPVSLAAHQVMSSQHAQTLVYVIQVMIDHGMLEPEGFMMISEPLEPPP